MDKIINELVRILTEEELSDIFDDLYSSLDVVECMRLRKMVASHCNLLSANAELSFKNQGLKLALETIGMIVTGEIMSNNIDKHLYTVLGIVKHELEELK